MLDENGGDKGDREMFMEYNKRERQRKAEDLALRTLYLAAKYDIYDTLTWDEDLQVAVTCNDSFSHGAEAVTITQDNFKTLWSSIQKAGAIDGPLLFCATVLGTKPLDQAYDYLDPTNWEAFDTCSKKPETKKDARPVPDLFPSYRQECFQDVPKPFGERPEVLLLCPSGGVEGGTQYPSIGRVPEMAPRPEPAPRTVHDAQPPRSAGRSGCSDGRFEPGYESGRSK